MRRRRAFTLIELLIVVAIIAILAAIAVPNFMEAQVRAKVARAKSDIRTMVTALEAYRVDHNKYVTNPAEGVTNLTDNSKLYGPGLAGTPLQMLTTPISYLSSLPEDAPFGPWRTGSSQSITSTFPVGVRGYLYQCASSSWSSYGDSRANWIAYEFWWPQWTNVEFVIYGLGPSKKFSQDFLGGSSLTKPYDPTNGTKSVGDIVFCQGTNFMTSFN